MLAAADSCSPIVESEVHPKRRNRVRLHGRGKQFRYRRVNTEGTALGVLCRWANFSLTSGSLATYESKRKLGKRKSKLACKAIDLNVLGDLHGKRVMNSPSRCADIRSSTRIALWSGLGKLHCSCHHSPCGVSPRFDLYTESRMLEETKTQSFSYGKLTLPPGPFKAYLFDCDGTIADSMPLHYIAWKQALGEWNCEFDEELFYAWGGMPIVEIISTLNQQRGLSMPVEVVAHRKENLYYELLPQLKAVPEVLQHINFQHGRIPFAVVSGSTRESVTASLTSLNLLDKFDALVCPGDYKKSKPDPEAFLLAAFKLGVAPKDCLVFEDTEMGIQAATAAGMASVRVPSPQERSFIEKAGK